MDNKNKSKTASGRGTDSEMYIILENTITSYSAPQFTALYGEIFQERRSESCSANLGLRRRSS